MHLTHNELREFAGAFQRLSMAFAEAARTWKETISSLPEPNDNVEVAADISEMLKMPIDDPALLYRFFGRSNPHLQLVRDAIDNAKSRPLAALAGRMVLRLLDEDHLEALANLKVAASSTNANDDSSVAAFWWNYAVPCTAPLDPRSKSSGQGKGVPARLEQAVRACEQFHAMLSENPLPPQTAPKLTVKGLAERTGESVQTIRNAATAAGIGRPVRGQHDRPFSPKDVYRIALARAESSRFDAATRQKWNELLKEIGMPTLDEKRQAVKRTRAE